MCTRYTDSLCFKHEASNTAAAAAAITSTATAISPPRSEHRKRKCKRIKCIFFSSGNRNNNSKCETLEFHALAQARMAFFVLRLNCDEFMIRLSISRVRNFNGSDGSGRTHTWRKWDKREREKEEVETASKQLNAILSTLSFVLLPFCSFTVRTMIDCFDSAKM